MLHTLIFYGSYLSYVSLIFFGLWLFRSKSKLKKVAFIFLILGNLLFIYSRFIERCLITERVTKIDAGFSIKLAVISDLHLGVYKGEDFLEKVVDKINTHQDLDAVLVAGDFTYYPKNIKKLFEPFKKIKIPVYAVLGNHDLGFPGPDIQEDLTLVLQSYGVHVLENQSILFDKTNIHLLALGDNWAAKDDIEKINAFTSKDHLIVLTHNPDTLLRYKNKIPDLTIAGHTHGGQIRIPFLYKKMIPSKEGFDAGFYHLKQGNLFITSGLGEVGLPMRLGILPVIDILELY